MKTATTKTEKRTTTTLKTNKIDKNEKDCGVLCGCYSAHLILTGPMEQKMNFSAVRDAEFWDVKTLYHGGTVCFPSMYVIICKGEALFD